MPRDFLARCCWSVMVKRPLDRMTMLCLAAAGVIGCGIVFAGKSSLAAWLGVAACVSFALRRMRSADR